MKTVGHFIFIGTSVKVKDAKKTVTVFFLFGERMNSHSDRIKPVWEQIKKETYQYSCEFSGLCYVIQ